MGDLEPLPNAPLALPTNGRSGMRKGSKNISSTKRHDKKDLHFEQWLKMTTEMINMAESPGFTLSEGFFLYTCFTLGRRPGPGRVSGLWKLMVSPVNFVGQQ